jgi:hypothetical protein
LPLTDWAYLESLAQWSADETELSPSPWPRREEHKHSVYVQNVDDVWAILATLLSPAFIPTWFDVC